MKRILYILLILLPGFGTVSVFAGPESVSDGVLSVRKYEKAPEKKISFLNKNYISHSSNPGKFYFNSTKRKNRGIQTFRFFSSCEQSLFAYFIDKEPEFSSLTLFIPRLHFSNEKRGPPSLLVS